MKGVRRETAERGRKRRDKKGEDKNRMAWFVLF